MTLIRINFKALTFFSKSLTNLWFPSALIVKTNQVRPLDYLSTKILVMYELRDLARFGSSQVLFIYSWTFRVTLLVF